MSTGSTLRRVSAWLRRYGPAEAVSLAITLASSWAALALTENIILAALAGTWAENVAYYGTMAWRELRGRGRLSLPDLVSTARDLALEFGPAELLDSFLVRPAALAASFALVPNPALAALLGKLAADVVFYLPTITSYELLSRRKRAGGEEIAS